MVFVMIVTHIYRDGVWTWWWMVIMWLVIIVVGNPGG